MNSLIRALLPLGLLSAAIVAQTISIQPANSSHLNGEIIRGTALSGDGKKLYTWGGSLREWTLPGLRSRILSPAEYNEGGCLMDVDRDGQPDLILQEGLKPGNLVWLHSPDWKSRTIDTEAELHDCLATTLLGHRGFLMIQRYSQVRFYEPAATLDGRWPMQEVYSYYTPSKQTGLLRADIDGDGLVDILAGNDWIKSPGRFDLPWRLFAINTYNEVADSAMLQTALTEPGDGLVVSQGHVEKNARLTWFEKPSDPKRLWIGHRLGDGLHLLKPHALAIFDFDGDGKPDIVVGEHNGQASRLFVFLQRERGSFQPLKIAAGTDAIAIWPTGPGEFVTTGADKVTVWRYTFRK